MLRGRRVQAQAWPQLAAHGGAPAAARSLSLSQRAVGLRGWRGARAWSGSGKDQRGARCDASDSVSFFLFFR